MRGITKKIKADVIAIMQPVVEEMAKAGLDHDQIVRTMRRHIDSKVAQFYRRLPEKASEIIKKIAFKNPDSKAEAVFYRELQEKGIPFKFHYAIGPYTADYLFDDHLVLELDGPMHSKKHDIQRDAYLRRMGYKIIRIPIWIMAMNPSAIIGEIKEQMGNIKQ